MTDFNTRLIRELTILGHATFTLRLPIHFPHFLSPVPNSLPTGSSVSHCVLPSSQAAAPAPLAPLFPPPCLHNEAGVAWNKAVNTHTRQRENHNKPNKRQRLLGTSYQEAGAAAAAATVAAAAAAAAAGGLIDSFTSPPPRRSAPPSLWAWLLACRDGRAGTRARTGRSCGHGRPGRGWADRGYKVRLLDVDEEDREPPAAPRHTLFYFVSPRPRDAAAVCARRHRGHAPPRLVHHAPSCTPLKSEGKNQGKWISPKTSGNPPCWGALIEVLANRALR
ncbi:hypothetical protein E2C01_045373 [Portunus trituberculatus]|uniref:Uncharacterized protein n=1 Tax=Portunus trituberculatus TaxID=210409 RepID=A0A5B7G137_PORTR|nr:hypothetical protein [Portunus trituberculatus]